MRAQNVAIIAAVGVVAFVLSRWTVPSSPVPAPVEPPVRTLTKSEIVYVDRTAPAAPRLDVHAAEPVAVEPTQAQKTAVANIERTVTTALAARRWRDEDRALIRAQTPYIEAEELLQQMSPLVVAVNQQQVDVELVGPLY
ncbi:MAG TPA: hypothetical protein VIU61_28905 [Kofleriaceae bacterium]